MSLERKQIASEEAIKVPLDIAQNFEVLLAKLKETIKTLGTVNQAFSKNPGLKESREAIEKLAKAQAALAKTETELAKQQKLLADAQIKLNKADQEKLKATQQLERAEQQRLKTEIESEKVIQAKTRTEIQARKEAERLAKQEERSAKAAISASSAYNRLSKELNEARQKYKDMAASGKASTAELRRQQKVVSDLDNRVKKIDGSVGQFQRNVGNYPRLLGSATNALKGFLGAFGLIGGIQLFANVIRNTFQRIRDFDKELVNLAAVAGKTRPQIKALEKEILAVSGSSINTANEVAALATELIKLGSTDEEARKLLKPVNDFSIALRASAEESAQFLKGMLNAFGVGAEEAGRFADVLSNTANRSALDFQGLNESMGYVAPTAKQLNIPLERLAAQIGTLADNNIKAARAGRLLNTSFAKLVTQGKTLDGALDEIRGSTDKVKTATELFGAESFTIGLILADNEDKVNRLTKELENSKGSLEELTNKQLKSLDAQLKILDSTWETFILGLENGNGIIAKVTTSIIGLAGGLLETGINLEKLTDSKYLGFFGKAGAAVKTWASYIPLVRLAFGDLNEGVVKELADIDNAIEKTLDGVNQEFQFGFKGLEPGAIRGQVDNIKFYEKELTKNLLSMGFSFNRASEIASIWRENTILEFKNVAKASKEELVGVGDTITEVIGNSFAKSLDALSKGGLDKFLESLKEDQAELVREFDRIGGSITGVDEMTDAQKNLKNEIEEVGKKISIVNNAIAVLGKDGVKEVNRIAKSVRSQLSDAFDDIDVNKTVFEDGLIDEKDVKNNLDNILKDIEAFGIDAAFRMRLASIEVTKGLTEEQERIISEGIEVISEVYRGFSDLRIQQISDELNALQHKRDRELEFISESGASEEQKQARIAAVNARYDAREKQLKQQQFKAEQQAALFQIAINTAVNAIKAFATGGFVGVGLALALGATQTAFVKAQKIPQFKDGVENFEGGAAVVSEEGQELMFHKGKAFLTPKKQSIIDVPKGADIIPHDLTMKILAGSLARSIGRDSVSTSFQDQRIVSTLEKTSKNVVKAINQKPVPTNNGYIRNGTRVKQLNFWRGI